MTRVLQVMALSTGGVGRHVASLVAGLDGPDLEVDVAAPAAIEIPMPKPVLPVDIPGGAGPSIFSAGQTLNAKRSLTSLIAAGSYDLVHAHGLRAALLSLDAAGPTPVVVTLHNLIHPETSGRVKAVLFRRGEERVLRRARHVFAVSQEMAETLELRVPQVSRKIEVLPIGLPAPSATRLREEVRRDLEAVDRPLLLTAARLVPQKALDVMLAATAQVDGAVLAIVGEGRLKPELQRQAKELGIAERVRFLGWQKDVGDFLHAADVFVLSSTWEARALAVQEAILAELPVVSTDVGGMPELIADGRSGFLVPPNDPGRLAAAIREMLESPDRAREFARAAKADLTSGYSADAMLARVRNVYAEVAGA